MKKLALIIIMMSMVAGSAMAAGGKIAYVDTLTIYEKSKSGKKYQAIMQEYYENRKKILDADADEIRKMQEDYNKQKQAKLLNETAQKEKEASLNRKINEFEKKRTEFGNEIGKKNEELQNEFSQQMVAVLKDIAKREKVSLVINKTINIMSKAEVPAVLYADDDLDLTEKVVAELDKKEK